MPEGLEAEIWRRALGVTTGRTITAVWADERVSPPLDALVGCVIGPIERRGKVVVITTDGPALGLHFGMTGRVVVDGAAPIVRLEYASAADRPAWDRLRVFTDPAVTTAPAIRMNDPRRLGRLDLDPDLDQLGVDLFDVDRSSVATALSGRRTAVKRALLDQRVIAGLGNLCADEMLWWASIAPQRPVDALTGADVAALTAAMRRRLPIMLRRGGSTTGVLSPSLRRSGGPCPRDGAELRRQPIGGRTAVWCPAHQH